MIGNKIDKTVEWIYGYCKNAGVEGIVVGLSGGVDSALVSHLIKRAFPDNSLAVILPCHSDPLDKEHALMCADSAGIDRVELDLSLVHASIWERVKETGLGKEKNDTMSDANLRARLRMSTIYAFANSMNYMVAGTDNAAELLTGYFTKHGDGGVDFLPIGNLRKYEVCEWARTLGVPKEVIEKPPSAGLWQGQTDEEEMGVTYREIDDYLDRIEISNEAKIKIDRLSNAARHKKEKPPMPPVF